MKKSSIHTIQNEVLQHNIQLPSNGQTKIFFIHIPRTTGDSLRTDLFGKGKRWLIDYSGWNLQKMPFDFSRMNRSTNVYDAWQNESVQIIKGHFGIADILNFNRFGFEQKIFTVLRHPIERVLSLFKFVSLHNCKILKRIFFEFSHCPNLTEFLQISNDKNGRMRQLTSNYVTWQIGSNVLHRNVNDFDDEALNANQYELAKKQLLRNVDFIGFYEDMWNDFEQIHERILPNIKGTALTRLIFNAGTFVSLPRMRTKKYSRQIGGDELKIIEKRNQFDLRLYEWARQRMNKSFKLYASYGEYAMDWMKK